MKSNKLQVIFVILLLFLVSNVFALSAGDISPTISVLGNATARIEFTSSSDSVNYSVVIGSTTYSTAIFDTYQEININNLHADTLYDNFTIRIWNSTGTFVDISSWEFTTFDYSSPSAPRNFDADYMWQTPRASDGIKIVRLNWTSSGDNGLVGTAYKYYVAYSTSPITNIIQFNAATQVDSALIPTPAVSGTEQEINLTDDLFGAATYYFAIIAEDDGSYNAAGLHLNSTIATTSIYIDRLEPNAPSVWWEYEYSLVENDHINIYGYTGENWSEVEVYARPADYFVNPGYINLSVFAQYNTTLRGTSTLSQPAVNSSEYIYIPLVSGNCPSFATATNYVEFANQKLDYYFYYDILSVVRDMTYCRVQLSQTPDVTSDIGTVVSFYNGPRPKGWFNISTQLYPGRNNISVRAIDYYYNSGNVSDTVQVVYDNNIPPTIDQDFVNNQTYRGEYYIDYTITDLSRIDINTLQVQIYNWSNIADWYLYSYPTNINCTPTNAYGNEYDCRMIFNTIPDGWYNFTINVSDIFGNLMSTTHTDYFKYLSPPAFVTLNDNGLIQTYNDNETSFYFNWTLVPPTPIIQKYEYAIGTKPYPEDGWDDVVALSEFNESFGNYTNFGDGNYQIWLDFSGCNPVCEPINDKKYYLNIRVYTPLNNSDFYSTDGVIFIDDEEPRTPVITILDVFNQSYLPVTNYLKFNFSSLDYSGIDKYEIVVSNERYYAYDGTTFVRPENLIYQDLLDAQVTNELTLTNLSLVHGEDYFIHVRAQDNVGLWSNFSIKGFTVDTTPVLNDSIQLPGGTTNPYTVRVRKGNDTESGILWEKLVVSYSNYENGACNPIYTDYYTANIVPQVVDITINLVDGKCHNFRLESRNRAGIIKTTYATGATYNQSVPLDLTPPNPPTHVVITSGNEVVTHNREVVEFRFDKATDPQSGIKKYEYWLQIKNQDGSVSDLVGPVYINNPSGDTITRTLNLATLPIPINLTHGREYRVMVKAYNNFNSSASVSAYSQFILYSDNTPPEIYSINVKDNSSNVSLVPYFTNGIATYELTTNSTNITISVSELDSTCRYGMTRALYDDLADPSYWWVQDKKISMYLNETIVEGVNDVYILCADQQYNKMDIWNAAHIKVIVDTTPPNITVITPVENETYGLQTHLALSIFDNSRLSSIWYRVVNTSNTSQIFINDTIVNETTLSDIILFNSSLENTIQNMTLLVFANDSKSNLGNISVNFTLNGHMPSIIFNEPDFAGSYYNSSFVYNVTVMHASRINITLYDNDLNLIYNKTYNSSINQNWNLSSLINVTELNISEDLYYFNVFAENNISEYEKNNYSTFTTITFDYSKFDLLDYNQYESSIVLPVNFTVYNNNILDGYNIKIISTWNETNNLTATAPIHRASAYITLNLDGVNYSTQPYPTVIAINGSITTIEFTIDKDLLWPGRTIYWKMDIEDEAGNLVETPIKYFNVANRELQRSDYLINNSNIIVHINKNATFNVYDYVFDPDYNPGLNYNIVAVNNSGVYNVSIVNDVIVATFDSQLGTQITQINVSDNLVTIPLLLNLTFVNYTSIDINNSEGLLLNLTVTSNDGQYDEENNINTANTSINVEILKGELNIINKETPFFEITKINGTNDLTLDLNISEVNISDYFNVSELESVSIGTNITNRYYPLNAVYSKINLSTLDFEIINLGLYSSLSLNYKIFAYDANETNVSRYTLQNVYTKTVNGQTVKYSTNNISFEAILIWVVDRATFEICFNGLDDDYDGSIDENCVAPSSGAGTTSSGGSRITSYIPTIPTVVENTTTITTPTTPTDTSEKEVSQTDKTKDNNLPKVPVDNPNTELPNTESPTQTKIEFDLKPIVSAFLFILILAGISVAFIKQKSEPRSKLTLQERLDYIGSKTQQKLNSFNVFDDKILQYLEYALAHNFALDDARKKLADHGFDIKQIDSHISAIKEKYNDINRIKQYLEAKWNDKKQFNKGIEELENVGWSKEYIDTAVNSIVNERL
ncbi:hypothetical protein JXM83_03015 [Candidatus Woesearchaeota archaeon]|nr:hypothetical protein [Candidatus Woesearchaeota archaeon]